MKGLLRGVHDDDLNAFGADLDGRLEAVFTLLDENESGEITLDELGKFLRELFKEQIKEMKDIVEREKMKNQS